MHREACTQRSFCTQARLHTEVFAQRNLYIEKLSHAEPFTHKSFHTEKSLHKETFTRRSFYTQKLLHRELFTQRRFYTKWKVEIGSNSLGKTIAGAFGNTPSPLAPRKNRRSMIPWICSKKHKEYISEAAGPHSIAFQSTLRWHWDQVIRRSRRWASALNKAIPGRIKLSLVGRLPAVFCWNGRRMPRGYQEPKHIWLSEDIPTLMLWMADWTQLHQLLPGLEDLVCWVFHLVWDGTDKTLMFPLRFCRGSSVATFVGQIPSWYFEDFGWRRKHPHQWTHFFGVCKSLRLKVQFQFYVDFFVFIWVIYWVQAIRNLTHTLRQRKPWNQSSTSAPS